MIPRARVLDKLVVYLKHLPSNRCPTLGLFGHLLCVDARTRSERGLQVWIGIRLIDVVSRIGNQYISRTT